MQKVAVVTGASYGLGAAISNKLIKLGYKVFGNVSNGILIYFLYFFKNINQQLRLVFAEFYRDCLFPNNIFLSQSEKEKIHSAKIN